MTFNLHENDSYDLLIKIYGCLQSEVLATFKWEDILDCGFADWKNDFNLHEKQ